MIPDERAFPNTWSGQNCLGLTKREIVGLHIASGILQGLYSFSGDMGKLTEADVAKAAWKMTDVLIKKS
jgi:hypothetical protein